MRPRLIRFIRIYISSKLGKPSFSFCRTYCGGSSSGESATITSTHHPMSNSPPRSKVGWLFFSRFIYFVGIGPVVIFDNFTLTDSNFFKLVPSWSSWSITSYVCTSWSSNFYWHKKKCDRKKNYSMWASFSPYIYLLSRNRSCCNNFNLINSIFFQIVPRPILNFNFYFYLSSPHLKKGRKQLS